MRVPPAVLLILIFSAFGPLSAMAQNPYTAVNDSRITLNGRIASTDYSGFELDYGKGLVRVEMEGWQWYHNEYSILTGSKVTVHGRIDDDRWETTSIDAESIYVKDINTYFYADAMRGNIDIQTGRGDPDKVFLLRGTIKELNGREFLLDTGEEEVKVDTLEMDYDPMDNEGYQQLKPGDYVQVTGELDVDFFEQPEITAETVTTFIKDPSKRIER